jgi:hypothetical protein
MCTGGYIVLIRIPDGKGGSVVLPRHFFSAKNKGYKMKNGKIEFRHEIDEFLEHYGQHCYKKEPPKADDIENIYSCIGCWKCRGRG